VGGDDYTSNSVLAATELYDPNTGTWSLTGSLNTARDSHVAVLLPSGQVLVAGGLGTPISNQPLLSSAELYSQVSGADLALALTDTPDPVLVKKTLTYTLTVGNIGPVAATGVTVTDPLPSAVTFISASPSQGNCTGTSTVTCALGNLAKGASATVTLTVTPTTAGTLSNSARVQGNEPDPDTANNTDTETTTVTTASQAITLSVTVTPQGGGTVTSNPAGITCSGGTCKSTYASGTQVTLTATPKFTWGGDCAGTTTATCTLTMNQDHSVKASFSKK